MYRYRLTNVPAYILTAIFLLIVFVFFALYIRTISVPSEYEEFDFDNIKADIEIYSNEQGLPHIIANNEHDAFFAAGYLHAQNRLWQMDFARRLANGRLSEILGEESIDIDKFMRTLLIQKKSEEIYKSLSKKSKSIISAYTKGVNSFIDNHIDKLPFEYSTLDTIPKQWSETDCIAISKLMAFELSLSFWSDITIGEMSENIGVDKALNLIPKDNEDGPYQCEDESKIYAIQSIKDDKNLALKELYKNVSKDLISIREKLGIKASSNGSNAWTINKNGASVLANDPHLTLSLPPRWMQVHISFPGFNAIGMSVPGIPLVLSGRNNDISWGITNLMLDDFDYFIEKIDPENQDKYFLNDTSKVKFTFVMDTIKIRNRRDSVYYQRFTERSIIISDFHIFYNPEIFFNFSNNNNTKFLDKYALSYNWTAHEQSDEILAMYKINKAKNWTEFSSALKTWGSPAQNFVYCDKKGNIGLKPSGYVAIRAENCNPKLPNPAWLDKHNWLSIEKDILPKSFNPKKGFIASANNKLDNAEEPYLTYLWESDSRAKRISYLLDESEEYNVREAQHMQNDILSPYALEMIELIKPILEQDTLKMDELQRKSYDLLIHWDGIMSAASYESSIYNIFLDKLITNTFKDELNEKLFNQYSIVANLPLRRIIELLKYDEDQYWFDDVFTNERENKEQIVKKSFYDAINTCLTIFDSENIANWRWGEIHQLTLKHTFSQNKFLEPTVTLGPFECSGNITTINNTEWRLYDPYNTVLGASMRMISDMNDSLVYTVLPGGISGDPLNPHYADQVQLWLNGGYLTMPVKNEAGENFKLTSKLRAK